MWCCLLLVGCVLVRVAGCWLAAFWLATDCCVRCVGAGFQGKYYFAPSPPNLEGRGDTPPNASVLSAPQIGATLQQTTERGTCCRMCVLGGGGVLRTHSGQKCASVGSSGAQAPERLNVRAGRGSPQPDPVYPCTAISHNRNMGRREDLVTPQGGGAPGDWTPSGPAGPLRSYVKW